jgi:hypothetical protein
MPRDYRAQENRLRARAARSRALNRTELRYASEPRAPAQGSTSFPVKVIDPEVQRMIDEAIAKKRGV